MTPLVSTDRTAGAIFFAAVALWIATEAWISVRRRAQPGTTVRDRGSQAVVIGSVYVGLLTAYGLADGVRGAAITWHRHGLVVAGVAVMLAGIALRLYAVRVLGRYFTTAVALRQGQRVVETGPYRWIRHPSYSGSLLTFAGLCLALGNWLAFVGLLGPLLGYAYRIRVEERSLLDGLGDEYRQYMKRTRRLIPYIV